MSARKRTIRTRGDGEIEEELIYQRDDVLLVVESIDDSMVISYANLELEDMYYLTTYLVERMSNITGVGYNETLTDLQDLEEESI